MNYLTATQLTWDPDQRRVITASSFDRLIVDTGAGTGKTAFACARLFHLTAEDDLEPNMISPQRVVQVES